MDLISLKTLEDLEKNGGLGPVCVKKYPHLRNRITDEVIGFTPKVLSL